MSAQLRVINEVRAAHAALERSAEAAFAEYATSVGFCLMLSKHQVRTLLYLDRMGTHEGRPKEEVGVPDQFIRSVRALEARGLVVHFYPSHEKPVSKKGWQPYKVTKIGRLVAALCRSAGL